MMPIVLLLTGALLLMSLGRTLFYEPDAFFEESRINTILDDPVVTLDARRREAGLAGGGKIAFAKALIATGGEPIRLDLPGADLDGVFYLRSIDDARAIAEQGGYMIADAITIFGTYDIVMGECDR